MSTNGTRRPHSEMLALALEVRGMLALACTRIAIAGSIRRGKELVGDIEIVCQPAGNLLHRQLDALLARGDLEQRRKGNGALLAWGDRYRAALYKGAALDVFIVLADRPWGVTYVLRTGPGEANEALVTQQGVVTRHGVRGIMPRGLRMEGGVLWRDQKRLETPEEVDVFTAVGLPYIAPPRRSAATYAAQGRMDNDDWVGGAPADDLWTPAGEQFTVQGPVGQAPSVPEPVAEMRQDRLL